MQQYVGEPLDKIEQDEKDQELCPLRPMTHLYNSQSFGRNAHIQKKHPQNLVHPIDDDGKNEKIEEHIKGIQPEVLSENGLFPTPRK